MTMLHVAQKEFQHLSMTVRRDNKKLELLRSLIEEYNGKHPDSAKLNDLILECLREHSGHVDFEKIVDFLTAQYAFLSRQKISLALTKCPYAEFNKIKDQWELKENKHIVNGA